MVEVWGAASDPNVLGSLVERQGWISFQQEATNRSCLRTGFIAGCGEIALFRNWQRGQVGPPPFFRTMSRLRSEQFVKGSCINGGQ